MNRALLRPDGAKKNFVFQIFYQVVILVIPLVVSPYLTRTMGSTSLGVYTYTYSIAYYFVVFAMLGINRHGQRIIAQRRGDMVSLRKTFWSLYCIHFIASLLALAAYLIYVFAICASDVKIALVQTIYVFSAALDITWLFYGLEKFRIVAVRNAIVKLLETGCIFLFVKSPSDVGVYTLIMAASACLGQLVMMPQVVTAIPPIRFSKADMKEHIRPLLTLFAAVIAVTLYTVFDKTLLGIMATKDDVAFYEYSDKIVKIPRTFIGVIGTVLFPRACRYAAEGDFKKLDRNFNYCLIVTCFIGFAACFGLAAVAKTFAVIYYGEAFAICGSVMISMCPIILIIGFGETVRQSYIYPLKMDSTMVKILSLNAVTNLILSALLIPVLGIYGAVVGTIGAETVGLVAEMWVCRKYLSFREFFGTVIPFAAFGAVMYAGVRLVAHWFDGSIIALLVQIAVGAVIYCVLSFIYGYFMNATTRGLIESVFSALKKRLRRAG
ncbi:MAG: oligosaccharide flippase family protein [Oscillospiraceae bacterium]|nr:oligosaccharide flippase family protein [Oscillospiraceae bacterium]